MKKRYIILSLICLSIFIIGFIFSRVKEVGASDKLEGIESFPSSYQPYLQEWENP